MDTPRFPARRSCPQLLMAGLVGASLTAAVALAEPAASPSAADLEFFESRVRPLLVQHCAECHSGTAGDPEGGLSFDSRADFFAAEGVAISGRPDDSLLVQVVRYDGDLQMPPDGRLPAAAIQTIEEWVRRGLPWPDDGRPSGGPRAAADAFDIAKRKAEHWCWEPPAHMCVFTHSTLYPHQPLCVVVHVDECVL